MTKKYLESFVYANYNYISWCSEVFGCAKASGLKKFCCSNQVFLHFQGPFGRGKKIPDKA